MSVAPPVAEPVEDPHQLQATPHPVRSIEDEEMDDGVGRTVHLFHVLAAALVVMIFLWAYFSPLDIVSITDGEVIPSTQVKQVQHLEGGIVRKILVREGDQVTRGQPLVELETASSDADVNEIRERLAFLYMEKSRLVAEAAGKDQLELDPELVKSHPVQAPQTLEMFRTRRAGLANKLSSQREIIIQRRQDMAEIDTRIRNQKQRFTLIEEQVNISKKLLDQDITNRYNHLDLLKEYNAIKSRVEEDEVALVRAEAQLKEAQSQLSGIQHTYDEETRRQLDDTVRQIKEYQARLGKYEDNLDRTTLYSPVDGVVKTLYVFTEGGVIQPAGTVVDIVPGSDRLVVEAKLRIQDIGYVALGQKAVLRLSSADATRFGVLNGEVVQVSPDTIVTKEGIPYYKVRIETPQDHFAKGDLRYRLFPGMILMVTIHTGQRTVMEYLLSPFHASMDMAMTER